MTTLSSAPAESTTAGAEESTNSDLQEQQQNERCTTHPWSASQISTMSNATTNSNSNSNPIRHSGRALVRGKFRRVWRPRHLEVWDNGLVRYYEVPVPATPGGNTLDVFVEPGVSPNYNIVTDNCDNTPYPHSKIPKSTLAIHHARIIDVTTLRDMHVGLPRGSFGFLFHGHQIDDEELTGGGEEDLFRDGMQLLSMGHCQGNTSLATPRDFLCAVNSLEEAQSWVIALQWAASMGRDNSFHSGSANSLPYTLPVGTGASHDGSWDHHDDVLSVASSLTLTSPQRQSGTSPMSPEQSLASVDTPAKPKQAVASRPSAGKMIVTKVVGYTLVRLESWKWEIAYQIQVLLVIPTQHQQQVQEWSIMRTGQDMRDIIEKLRASLSSTTGQKIHQQTERIALLPTLQSSQRSINALGNSISVVDSILRSFCMEAAVVNSPSMKRFLGLHHSSVPSVQHGSPFWKFHNPTAVLSRPKRTIIQQNIDQFVKQWLQRPKQKRATPGQWFRLLCWYLRLPQPATTYAGALLLSLWLSSAIFPSWNRFVRKSQALPYVSIRLDALILSWCAAAGVGRFLGGNRRLEGCASTSRATSGRRLSKPKGPIAASETGSMRTSPAKSLNSLSNKDVLRSNCTPNKSLMDEDDSEEMVVDDGEDEDIEEDGGVPDDDSDAVEATAPFLLHKQDSRLSSPLPEYSTVDKMTDSCWSKPKDKIFNVRGPSYLTDRVKIPSGNASFTCQGVDMWITDNPERHIARHPSVLGGRLANADQDMFLVNFLLPFGNFVSYFSIPPLEQFANPQLADVWTRFIEGDQQYRDARLKLLPVVVDGPWIVRAAVPGTSPALLGKVIPLQYFFTQKSNGRSIYEVDVIITASSIAKGILSVVKGHAKAVSIAFAFIIEAAEEHELPETVLASFQIHSLHLEDCPLLPALL